MITSQAASGTHTDQLPWMALLALALAGFLVLLTEIIPAGMLLQMSQDIGVSEALTGQLVTVYAIGSILAAIPLTAATMGWRRKPLLITALCALLTFNTLTALTTDYTVTLIARLFAGMAGGLLWGIMAGYARRMVPDHLKGRALAIVGIGAPLALSLGVPLGTLLGATLGWRFTFGALSLLTLLVIAWIAIFTPDYPGQTAEKRLPLRRVILTPGVAAVMAVLVLWVLAHNVLYTFILPFLVPAGMADQIGIVLLVFGLGSVAGIWVVGVLIDRMLRKLVLLGLGGFALAALMLGLANSQAAIIYLAIALWGFTFGGSPTLLQTASADTAGQGADVAQSILVTCWNLAIAGGGILGGVLLETLGVATLPWALLMLIVPAVLIVWYCRQHGFVDKSVRFSG
jgi:predicted MFS family arabinose efflux permease